MCRRSKVLTMHLLPSLATERGFQNAVLIESHSVFATRSLQNIGRDFQSELGNGCVVTWGYGKDGADSSAVQKELRNGRQIQATHCAAGL